MPSNIPRKNYGKVEITPLDPETALPREPAPLRLNETPWQKAMRTSKPLDLSSAREELIRFYDRPGGYSGD